MDTPLLEPLGVLRAAAARFPNGSISVLDTDLRCHLAEGSALAAVGLSGEQMRGRTLWDLFDLDDVTYVEPFFRRAFAGEPVQFELPAFGRVYHMSAGPLTDKIPTPAIVVVAQDITDLNQAHESLAAHGAQLEEALRLLSEELKTKDEHLAMIAHELRQPLHASLSGLALMRLRKDREAGSRAREAVERQILHMSRIVSNVLDAVRLGQGQLPLHREVADVAEILRESVDIVRASDSAPNRFQLAVPDHTVLASVDPTRIQQVFVNLLTNAARHTDAKGLIAVTLIVRPEGVHVSVRDTGVGIDADDLDRIFQPFNRGSRPSGSGLGVGLTLAKRIVDHHGGTLTVFSEGAGSGAEFRVLLPYEPPIQAPGSPNFVP